MWTPAPEDIALSRPKINLIHDKYMYVYANIQTDRSNGIDV